MSIGNCFHAGAIGCSQLLMGIKSPWRGTTVGKLEISEVSVKYTLVARSPVEPGASINCLASFAGQIDRGERPRSTLALLIALSSPRVKLFMLLLMSVPLLRVGCWARYQSAAFYLFLLSFLIVLGGVCWLSLCVCLTIIKRREK